VDKEGRFSQKYTRQNQSGRSILSVGNGDELPGLLRINKACNRD
jgi:hypothetical protein